MENTIELRRDLVVAIRRWRPHAIFTHDPEQTLPPDYYVDIRAGLERKIEARLLHVSQTVDGDALRVGWRKRAAAIGEAAGLVAAEAFTVLTVD